MATEKAIFAAGCFWGVEAAFRQVEGVLEVTSGYSGGHTEHPSYRAVGSDRTGHAEAVQVEFDPAKVSYDRLLDVFWQIHDPTQVNRQGPDVGTQYRSAIFYLTPEQETAAKSSRERAQDGLSRPIATEITQASTFWPAEEYHQRYFEKHGFVGCHVPTFE
jgi:peptide-methionine (S)-S-oxide reductase